MSEEFNWGTFPTGGEPLSESQTRRVVLAHFMAYNGIGQKSTEAQLDFDTETLDQIVAMIPEAFRTESSLQTINYLPILAKINTEDVYKFVLAQNTIMTAGLEEAFNMRNLVTSQAGDRSTFAEFANNYLEQNYNQSSSTMYWNPMDQIHRSQYSAAGGDTLGIDGALNSIQREFDYEQFGVDDWQELFRTSATFGDAFAQMQRSIDDYYGLYEAGAIQAPAEGVPSVLGMQEYAQFDIGQAEYREFAQNPAEFLDQGSILQLKNLPYMLDDEGRQRLGEAMHLAGYFTVVGGTPPSKNDVFNPFWTAAWNQALRDTIASGKPISQIFDEKTREQMNKFDRTLREQRGSYEMSINNVARQMLSRDLTSQELSRVFNLITTFTDEERADLMSGESTVMDELTPRAVAGIQQTMGEEVETIGRGRNLQSLASLSFDDFLRSPSTSFQEPQLGVEL